jgi:GntR family transcriptional repressor for pyruvate dehydrogenase complex
MNKLFKYKPVRKTKLYEEVAEQLKESIYGGYLAPGDRLPSERELCEIFQVGRPTIREAIRTLSIMGLVQVNQGSKGTIVGQGDINQYMEALRKQLSWIIKVDDKTYEEIWEVKKYIQLGIAHAASKNATTKGLKKLDSLIKKMEEVGDDIKAYFPIGIEFHKEMAIATKNRMFFLAWQLLQDIFIKAYSPIVEKIFPEGPSKPIKANKILLEAIKSRDPQTVDKAMEFHASEDYFNSKKQNAI